MEFKLHNMGTLKDLIIYQKAYKLALDIHLASFNFPSSEKYDMINQIRRSSKSVCANFAEAYRRRKYRNHFVAKISDCLAESTETGVWLDFASDLGFLELNLYNDFQNRNDEVSRMLAFVLNNPEKFTK